MNNHHPEFMEKLVSVNRVSKTVKGGRRMSFSVIVVVGDGKGSVGIGKGKALEVPDAVKKASDYAKKHMSKMSLYEGRTVHHDIVNKFGSSYVIIRSASSGTGIIASGTARAIFECVGIKDIVCKSLKSSNPANVLYAVFNALVKCESPRMVANRRGIKVSMLNNSAY